MVEQRGFEFWPGWMSGLALAGLLVAYFWVTGRMVTSSGRVSVIIDRLRQGPTPMDDASPEELAQALRQASIETFGAAAVQAELARLETEPREASPRPRPRHPITWVGHLLFMVGLILGGRLSRPGAPIEWSLGPGAWASLSQLALPPLLLLAGVLVGFGTRMAGGCPIGHGLCGMARGQPGSWVAGVAFFAAGIGVWLVLGGP